MITIDSSTLLVLAAMAAIVLLALCLCLIILVWQNFSLKNKLAQKNKQVLDENQLEELLKEKLEKLIEQNSAKFNELAGGDYHLFGEKINNLQNNTIKIFAKISKDIETQTVSEVSELRETLKNNLNKAYGTMLSEVAQEKELRIKDLGEKIGHLSRKVIEEVLEKSISQADHQKLVSEALEKAKKQGVFK